VHRLLGSAWGAAWRWRAQRRGARRVLLDTRPDPRNGDATRPGASCGAGDGIARPSRCCSARHRNRRQNRDRYGPGTGRGFGGRCRGVPRAVPRGDRGAAAAGVADPRRSSGVDSGFTAALWRPMTGEYGPGGASPRVRPRAGPFGSREPDRQPGGCRQAGSISDGADGSERFVRRRQRQRKREWLRHFAHVVPACPRQLCGGDAELLGGVR